MKEITRGQVVDSTFRSAPGLECDLLKREVDRHGKNGIL